MKASPDDKARGGDIDLLVEIPHAVDNPAWLSVRISRRISYLLGGQKGHRITGLSFEALVNPSCGARRGGDTLNISLRKKLRLQFMKDAEACVRY